MDFNEEEEVLISLREMENSDEEEEFVQNGVFENGHSITKHPSYHLSPKGSLSWLDLRVFYVRISECVLHDDDSAPEYLTLNHIPLRCDTLLEANGVRASIYSDGFSTLLKRDRLDRKSEVTFVSTDSIRTTGSVKFEVFHRDVLVLSGNLELCHSNGFMDSSRNHGMSWSMNCESDLISGAKISKGNHNQLNMGQESSTPAIVEVYIAGCFSGSPIVLTKTLQLSHKRKQVRKGMLEAIPEYESTLIQKDDFSSLTAIQPMHNQLDYKPEEEIYCSPYQGMDYLGGEDGELSWFNAGVRVGVGIGLSICLGVGIGVGLLVRTYQGTTRNFTRRLL